MQRGAAISGKQTDQGTMLTIPRLEDQLTGLEQLQMILADVQNQQAQQSVLNTAKMQNDLAQTQINQNLALLDPNTPTGLTKTRRDEIAAPFEFQLEMTDLAKNQQVAESQFKLNQYEVKANQAINEFQKQQRAAELRMAKSMAIAGKTFDENAIENMETDILEMERDLTNMKLDAAQTSGFMAQQIDFLEQGYTNITNQVTREMNQSFTNEYNRLKGEIYKLTNEQVSNLADRDEKIATLTNNYYNKVIDIYSSAQERINAETEKTSAAVNWLDNHEELNIIDGKNYKINPDGSVNLYWLNKQTGEIETTTKDLGLTPELGSVGDISAPIKQPYQQSQLDDLAFKYNSATPSGKEEIAQDLIERG